jgi:hypothetical protein
VLGIIDGDQVMRVFKFFDQIGQRIRGMPKSREKFRVNLKKKSGAYFLDPFSCSFKDELFRTFHIGLEQNRPTIVLPALQKVIQGMVSDTLGAGIV